MRSAKYSYKYPSEQNQQSSFKSIFLKFILMVVLLFLLWNFWNNSSPTQVSIKNKPTPNVKGIINTPYVSANETNLYLNGKLFKFTGVNAYSLASADTNAGCGGQMSGVEEFFSSLKPNSVVRMWAFQGSMVTNIKTKKLDWTALDKIEALAKSHNQKLIFVFTGQAGTCDDGHWKDKAWYKEGYKKSFNNDKRGLAPLPYIEFVKQIVDRYKNSTTIAMWELVNEPESSDCPKGFSGDGCYTHQICFDEKASADALRSFYDTVGGIVKSIDKNHIIESGVLGSGQCGAVFEDYTYIHQSPNIDVASYHDYGGDHSPMPGDIWNGLQKRLNQMKSIGKPLIIGEVGILAMENNPKCVNLSTRHNLIKAKMDTQFAAGIAGFLPWDYTGGTSPICNFDIGDSDPTMTLLHDYQL